MTAGAIIAVIFITLAIGAIFFYGLKKTGPWGSLWTFLLVLFLGIFMAAIWIVPIGPIWYGAAWFDLFIIGILLALVLAAATPTSNEQRRAAFKQSDVVDEKARGDSAIALGGFFWLMIILFVIIIGIGFVR